MSNYNSLFERLNLFHSRNEGLPISRETSTAGKMVLTIIFDYKTSRNSTESTQGIFLQCYTRLMGQSEKN